MSKPQIEQVVIKQLKDELEDTLALVKAVSRPGESLTVLQAIRRYLDINDPDGAAELAVLCAHADPDACVSPDTMMAECYRLFDRAMAL